MLDNPVLFPPMSALSFPINKSTLFGTFLRQAPDPDVNLSIKPSGGWGGGMQERRARHSLSLAASPRLGRCPYFPEDNSKEPSNCGSYARRHFNATTYTTTPHPPPRLPSSSVHQFHTDTVDACTGHTSRPKLTEPFFPLLLYSHCNFKARWIY